MIYGYNIHVYVGNQNHLEQRLDADWNELGDETVSGVTLNDFGTRLGIFN